MTIRVLIVDDSALMRALLEHKLAADPQIEVVGKAPDAAEARQRIKELNPDVVTLDIEMPGMDGLSFLQKIMELRPTPVIIVSGATGPGAEATARALQLGAVACYAKSSASTSIRDDDGGVLVSLVHEAAQVKLPPPRRHRTPSPAPSPAAVRAAATSSAAARSSAAATGSAAATSSAATRIAPKLASDHSGSQPDLIVIGSSTGGVEALHDVLSGFPVDCPPTLIVQHINSCFAPAIAQSLDRSSRPRVALADADRPVQRGEVMIAPGDKGHMTIMPAHNSGRSGKWHIMLRPGAPISGHLPSVDALFQSVAEHAGASALGILLTGMGRDGAQGLLAMAQNGAATIAQDEESCVVFGMPRAAIELGAARQVLPLSSIAGRIFRTPSIAQRKAS